MTVLTNTAVVNTFSYSIGPSVENTSTSNLASIDINILEETVVFHKTNFPTYVTPGNTIDITYTITNISLAPIRLITVKDPIFTMPNVTLSDVTGGSIVNNVLTFDLSLLTRILPGTTVTSTVSLIIEKAAAPDSILYDTTATASLTLLTIPETTETRTSKGHLEVNAAIVTLSKNISPPVDKITSGNLVTFTITFNNSGNVDAEIASYLFSDTWNIGSLTDVTCTDANFLIDGNRITNLSPMLIPAHSILTLSYSGIVVYI